ncbi:contactin-associated protein-like 4 [Neosynchiropus ocellatus]
MDSRSGSAPGILAQVALILFSASGTTGAEACHSSLISSLPPSSFRSSSQISSSHSPGFAKLNRRDGAGGWSPLTSDGYQWLEVDLGERRKITAIATQGRYGSSDWQTAYQLMLSDTGHNWKQYRQEDSIGVFPGNTNADSVVQHNLRHPVTARYVRLIPLDWNANGRIGLRMEAYGCSYDSGVVSFDGRSGLLYDISSSMRQRDRERVSFNFKTFKNSGILLHATHRSQRSLVLELEEGKLHLILHKDSSSPESQHHVTLGSLLDDQHWHHVAVEHHLTHLNFSVDKNTLWVQVAPKVSHWDYDKMSVGVDQDLRFQKKNLYGCLENLVYNGLNLVDFVKQRDQRVAVKGNVSFSCSEPVLVAMTFNGPQSFLWLPAAEEKPTSGFSVRFQFRTWNKAGLLLSFQTRGGGGVAWLFLTEAALHLQTQKSGRTVPELTLGSALNDGQWHSVELSTRRGRWTARLDEEEEAHSNSPGLVTAEGRLYFGGCPPEQNQDCENPFKSFQGCMRLLTVNDQLVDLIKVQQRLLGNYSQLQIDMCGFNDRCSPSRCEHGGTCSQSWSDFYCNCSDTGYSGATCHSAIFEQSCEAYKHRGNRSGYYYIDVDGSGPISPQLLYCNMTEDKTWIVIRHNNTALTTVPTSMSRTQFSAHFQYESNEELLEAVIGRSEHCEQELAYRCWKSRLFKTQDGLSTSWWVGGPGRGRKQAHWAGAPPGNQQCACGVQKNCVDPRRQCNCDADHDEWTDDSGLLTHKETLPVRSLVLSDVQRPDSERAFRVGPLRCHGDKNLWNAAFFDKETSYLHFPTFHGELSADISFLFKTSSSSGVFLENLGIKDFIRIELSSSTEVVLSFDVGNGPLEVHMDAGVPLNDNRWHRIRAERNVKEASLQLDDLPAATQKAPADGHIHLQLNSQLFIGGTASRQKGFRGCIRSLKLNGVTLDLEERANITPGVQAGCPGHCSSYGSLCQNQGLCVERSTSFSCDCRSSAYTGAFCDREVSAAFKPETSISYLFKQQKLHKSINGFPSSIYSDVNVRGENFSLSFRTSRTPAVLLYVDSFSREYLALLLDEHDNLELWYRLDGSRKAETLRSRVTSLANGELHSVAVSRLAESVSLQVDENPAEHLNLTSDVEFNALKSLVLGRLPESKDLDPDLAAAVSLGFSGCLSAVLFNSISPLKAALLHSNISPVVISGPLAQSTCGSTSINPHPAETRDHLSGQSGSVEAGQPLVKTIRSDSALIGGLIAVVIFLIASVAVVLARFFYRRKGTCQSREGQSLNGEDASEQTNTHSALTETHREYFI